MIDVVYKYAPLSVTKIRNGLHTILVDVMIDLDVTLRRLQTCSMCSKNTYRSIGARIDAHTTQDNSHGDKSFAAKSKCVAFVSYYILSICKIIVAFSSHFCIHYIQGKYVSNSLKPQHSTWHLECWLHFPSSPMFYFEDNPLCKASSRHDIFFHRRRYQEYYLHSLKQTKRRDLSHYLHTPPLRILPIRFP